MSDTAENPRAVPGANNPPGPVMPVPPGVDDITAALRTDHAKFLADAEAWIASVDRAPKVIETPKQAEAFAKTISELMKARTGAEKIHANAKKPWFDITKAIDAVFLAGVKNRAEAAEKIMLVRQKVWITKVRDEQIKAEQQKAREAETAAQLLRDQEAEAMRQAERAMDTGDMEAGNALLTEAVQASEAAAEQEQTATVATDRAEGKTADLVREHHSVGVTTSAKTFWNVELLPIDKLAPADLAKFWTALAPYIGADVRLKAAKAAVKAGLRECPGLRCFEDFQPINR